MPPTGGIVLTTPRLTLREFTADVEYAVTREQWLADRRAAGAP